MKRMTLRLFLLLLVCLMGVGAGVASAEVPFQFSAPSVRAPDDPDVNGVRFSLLHGKNQSVSGLDLGLLSLSETKNLSGAAFVLGISKVTGEMSGGAAFALINVHMGKDSGLNAAFINRIHSAENAVTVGFVNIADGTTMVDVGGLNVSDRSTAQIGFINVTKKLKGFQFGFVNIAENGFLPVFPIFNFPKTSNP
jgi:hypothetical protein